MIDQQISLILQRRLIDAFEGFSKELRKFCSQEEAAASIPLTVGIVHFGCLHVIDDDDESCP